MQAAMAKTPTDALTLNYNPLNPFSICAISFTPIYQGNPSVLCVYCKAHHLPIYDKSVCGVCDLSQVGGTGTGLNNLWKP